MATGPNPVSLSSLHQNTAENNSTTSVSQSIPTQQSQIQITPRAVSPSLANILPSNQAAVSGTFSTGNSVRSPGTGATTAEAMLGMEAVPVPLRLPKPLTAVDLYAQLEKEQEAVVNRLTRELSLLRAAQNASVVSSVSSTSASGLPENNEYNISSILSNRQRSSSVASCRSMTANNPTTIVSSMAADRAVGRTGLTRRESNAGINQMSIGGNNASRRNSASKFNLQSQIQNGPSSPIAVPINHSNYQHYYSADQWASINSYPSRPAPLRDYASRSQSIISSRGEKEAPLNNRCEEVATYRNELENVKKENEVLRRRVRELEGLVSQKKQMTGVGVVRELEKENVNIAESDKGHKEDLSGDNCGGVRLAESVGFRDTTKD